MMDIGTITARVKTRGTWKLFWVGLLGRWVARRGVDVRVSITTALLVLFATATSAQTTQKFDSVGIGTTPAGTTFDISFGGASFGRPIIRQTGRNLNDATELIFLNGTGVPTGGPSNVVGAIRALTTVVSPQLMGDLSFWYGNGAGSVEGFRLTHLGLFGVQNTAPTATVHVTGNRFNPGGTVSATSGTSTFTTTVTTTINVGDYLVPDTSLAQARVVTVGGTGTSFTASPAFTGNVVAETFFIHRPLFRTDTWNGVTGLLVQGFTGQIQSIDGSNAVPAYSFTSCPTCGMRWQTNELAFVINGTRYASVKTTGINIGVNNGVTLVDGGAVDLLGIGGDSASFPGIKRSTTRLQARLANDSAFTGVDVGDVRINAVTFANRPATPVEGMMVAFTDSTTNVWGATITGTGANHVLGYYDGTNWTVAAK